MFIRNLLFILAIARRSEFRAIARRCAPNLGLAVVEVHLVSKHFNAMVLIFLFFDHLHVLSEELLIAVRKSSNLGLRLAEIHLVLAHW